MRVARWLPLLAVFAAAIGLRLVLVANTDVSWLITLSEKVLDGQRLYVDLIEVNPPASVFLYLPLVALARVLALRPEVVVDAGVFFAIGVSLGLASHILRQARRARRPSMRCGSPCWRRRCSPSCRRRHSASASTSR